MRLWFPDWILRVRASLRDDRRRGLAAAACAVLGLLLLIVPENALLRVSFDSLAVLNRWLRLAPATDGAVILYLDDKSFGALQADPKGIFPPRHLEEFLDGVSMGGQSPSVVVFDLLFDDPSTDYSGLCRAMTGRRVVVGTSYHVTPLPGGAYERIPREPVDCIRTNTQLGVADFPTGPDEVVRRHWIEVARPALARQVAGHFPGVRFPRDGQPLWLNFYGAAGAVEGMSFFEWRNNRARLKDRIVFVGIGEGLDARGTSSDRHRVPGGSLSGVELQATATLNLLRDEAILELGPIPEVILVLLIGLALGFRCVRPPAGQPDRATRDSLQSDRLRALVQDCAFAGIATLGLAVGLFRFGHLWSPWLIPVAAQIPCAAAWGIWAALAPAKPRYDVFVSYRREGGSEVADLLRTRLAARGINAFVDVSGLGTGSFSELIPAVIQAAPAFLLIIADGTLDRCHEENDWVRREIRLALEHHRLIIPLLDCDRGGALPPSDRLPPDIAGLLQFNALEYHREHYLLEGLLTELTRAIRA